MNNDPNQERKDVESARYERIAEKSRELLTADEATHSEFDRDGNGAVVYQLELTVDSTEENILGRLGYSQLSLIYVPETQNGEGEENTPEIIVLTASSAVDESQDVVFSISKDRNGQRVIQKESDDSIMIGVDKEAGEIPDDLLSDTVEVGFIPDAKPITPEDELELQSLLNAMRENVTLPGEIVS